MAYDEHDDDLNIDLGVRPPEPRGPGRSGLGIASLVLASVSGVLFLVAILGVSLLPQAQQPGPPVDGGILVTGVGAVGLAILIMALVGLVLGIAGVFGANSTGLICAITGIVLNSLILVVMVVLTCAGVAMMAVLLMFLFLLLAAMGGQPRGGVRKRG